MSAALARQRILIVEDEPLVAMVLELELEDLGVSVAGICVNVADALRSVERQAPEAAILDVNLGGELIYPVAEALRARGIPFVFITGYGQESIDRRFADVLVLEKPVEREMLSAIFHAGTHIDASSRYTRDSVRVRPT